LRNIKHSEIIIYLPPLGLKAKYLLYYTFVSEFGGILVRIYKNVDIRIAEYVAQNSKQLNLTSHVRHSFLVSDKLHISTKTRC